MLTDLEKLELGRVYKDAKVKTDSLPARLKDEYQQAEVENRQPYAVEPLTSIKASLLMKAIGEITTEPPKDCAEWIGVQRKACSKLGDAMVALRSEQLKAILDAAGVGADAKV